MSARTNKQNAALHVYFEDVAEALNNAGLDMEKVLELKTVSIPWSKELVKEALWRPIQEAMIDKESTTEMDTKDPSDIYLVLHRHLAEKLGIDVPWPDSR